jgi:hypothetical protein
VGIRFAGLLLFVLLVVAFIYDRILGIRALGLVETMVGAYWLKVGRIPYGWRGRPATGYLTGWLAITVAVAAIGLGILFLAEPRIIDTFVVAPNNRWRGP